MVMLNDAKVALSISNVRVFDANNVLVNTARKD